jgi:NAD(P)H-dependent FMN reductase
MKLAVIVGTTRPNRQTFKQAKWVVAGASEIEDIDVELVDLKDYPMPFFNEPVSPRYNPDRKISVEAKPWLDKLTEFDAYVFVTAEYNHSIPAELKNALDYSTWEMNRKPVAVVSHGSAGGVRAATDLKEVLSESKAVPIPNFVAMLGMSELIDEEGNLGEAVIANPYGPQATLTKLLEELQWYSNALTAARVDEKVLVAA